MKRFIFGILFLTLFLSSCGDKATDAEPTNVKATTVKKAKKEKSVEVEITVTHEDSWWDKTSYHAFIDDKELLKMKPGQVETFKLKLKKGSHEFYVKNDGLYKTNKLSFDVENDDPISFYFKVRQTFGIKLWKTETPI